MYTLPLYPIAPPHWVLGTRLAALHLPVLEMPPRCLLRRLMAAPSRALSTTSSSHCSVMHSAPQDQEATSTTHSSVSTHSALQRQQLEFCCLLCGWDVACSTCPFNLFHFDPNKFRSKQRRRPGESEVHKFRVSELDIQHALETLEIAVEPTNGFAKAATFTQQQVKDAFRVKALEWHPDCNEDPEAETIFKEILQAYELLLAHTR